MKKNICRRILSFLIVICMINWCVIYNHTIVQADEAQTITLEEIT